VQVKAKGVVKDTLLPLLNDAVIPLLKDMLHGVSSLNLIAFGFKLLAWAMERSEQHHNNYEQCREILLNTLFLLKDTLSMWEEHGSNSSTEDLMHFNLPRIAEASFRASIITYYFCSSSNNINRYAYNYTLRHLCSIIRQIT
jgi:hypothetical protein